jgi:hypothetical protein
MRLVVRTLSCLWLCSSVACSSTSPAAASRPAPGPMATGERWRGVYQGPYHIMLNVWTRGAWATGNWRAVGDREGEFSGSVNGALMVIDWTEQGNGDSKEAWSGRGYFVYAAGKAGAPAQIYGESSMDGGARSSSWWAVKRSDEPLGSAAGQLDKDADQQYQEDSGGCEMGNCNSTDNDVQ